MQLYPDWSSRANQTRGKKRKRNNKQEPNDSGINHAHHVNNIFHFIYCLYIRSLSFLFLFVYGYQLLHDSIRFKILSTILLLHLYDMFTVVRVLTYILTLLLGGFLLGLGLGIYFVRCT